MAKRKFAGRKPDIKDCVTLIQDMQATFGYYILCYTHHTSYSLVAVAKAQTYGKDKEATTHFQATAECVSGTTKHLEEALYKALFDLYMQCDRASALAESYGLKSAEEMLSKYEELRRSKQ